MNRIIDLAAIALSLDGRTLGRAARRNAIAGAIIFVLLLSAYGWGVAALAIWLSTKLGALGAVLTLALASLALALFALVWLMLMNRADKLRYEEARIANAEMLSGILGLFPAIIRERPISGLAAIAGLAFLFTRNATGKKRRDS
ncbi:hypothetical protein FJU08_10565 [Martelella alba]|uniref:Uncharacterized protein n=1 Tax=Martelella alba TaxID=2590451 RepID=A0A506UCE8_9HYPH|nr:hypothetical protein [Martelella alba]TPW31086.1 hypothetical protein FJU08_10565 [Martelella alba]